MQILQESFGKTVFPSLGILERQTDLQLNC